MKYSKIQARQIAHRLGQYLNEFKKKFEIKQIIFITVFNSKELIIVRVCMSMGREKEKGRLEIKKYD